MSKSRGTGIDAREAMEQWGADVLRLWAASVEPIDDVRFGPNVVEQVGRVYRNLRNRMRFMLSNLDDLRAADVVARDAMAADRPSGVRRCRHLRRRRKVRVRSLPDPRRVPADRRVRERDVGPLLRRAQGSALLARGRRRAAPQRAIGAALRADALRHRARARALVHRRGGVAGAPGRPARRRGERVRHVVRRRAPSRRLRGRAEVVAAAARAARAGGRCGRAARLRSASCGSPSRPTPTSGSRRSATTCAKRWSSRSWRWSRTSARTPMRTTACSFSSSRRPTARSASAAGSTGELGVDPAHPSICAECAEVVRTFER